MTEREWWEVTISEPCPACGKPDWCAWTREGWLKCERCADAPQGMARVSVKDGGGLFRPNHGNARSNPHTPRQRPSKPRAFPTAAEAIAKLESQYGPRADAWAYTDKAGDPLGMMVRWNPHDGDKIIRPVARNGAGWIIGAMPKPWPLYRLDELAAMPKGSSVYVTEGEPAVEAVRLLGLTATTSPHGSNCATKAEWSPLAGFDVVILPDHDKAGRKYADDAARLATASGAASVRIVQLVDLWAGMPEGGDIADYMEHHGGNVEAARAELEALADSTEAVITEPAPINGTPKIVRLMDVKSEPVAWLWPGRFALGKLTLIGGDPGLGKSFLTLDMAARVSSGAPWPDAPDVAQPPGGVVLLNAEDGLADTIRPRLDAAGADINRIVAIDSIHAVDSAGRNAARSFDLSDDISALESAIHSVGDCRLVVIDPITAFLGGTDSHKNADVRGLLAPLSELAERLGVAVVAVTHLNKSAGGSSVYRMMGSLAFTAAARSVLAVSKDKDDPCRRLMIPVKNNLAPDVGGMAYRIQSLSEDGYPVVEWEPDPVDITADDALSWEGGSGNRRTERDDAADWLRELLANEPVPAIEVEENAGKAGLSWATVKRAKATIGIVSRRIEGHWKWAMPDPGPTGARCSTAQDAHTTASEHLGQNPHETGNAAKVRTAEEVSALNSNHRESEVGEPENRKA